MRIRRNMQGYRATLTSLRLMAQMRALQRRVRLLEQTATPQVTKPATPTTKSRLAPVQPPQIGDWIPGHLRESILEHYELLVAVPIVHGWIGHIHVPSSPAFAVAHIRNVGDLISLSAAELTHKSTQGSYLQRVLSRTENLKFSGDFQQTHPPMLVRSRALLWFSSSESLI